MQKRHQPLTNSQQRLLNTGAIAIVGLAGVLWLSNNLYRDVQLGLEQPQATPSSRQPQSQSQAVSIETLIASNLFGANTASLSGRAPEPTEKVPETRLSLELRGTFASSVEAESRALIAEKGKSAKYYKLDDTLPGRATLAQVADDHVMLRRNGRLETLSFNLQPRPDVVVKSNPAPRPAPNAKVSPATESDKQQAQSLNERLQQLRDSRNNPEKAP